MEPCKEAITVRITRLNRQIIGKVTSVMVNKFNKRTIDREALLDALTVLYDECNDDPVKKTDELVRTFVDKYRSTLAELRRMRVCIADFEVIQTIGRGHFAEVYMVREKQTGDVYALKALKKELARKRVSGAEDERDVLANANVPWIPKLQYAFQDNSHLYLVMELCSGGDLAGLIARRNNPLSERDAAFYVAEVAHALKALHGMGYVHRDVKPHNIFLDRCGHIKLGDFGSCARLSEGGVCAGAATADYVAPELLAAAACAGSHAACMDCCRGITSNALSACDYWSLGVIAFELVTLRRPFSTGDDDSVAKILSNIQKYERESCSPPFPAPPEGPSREWRALVAGLLAVQPSKRYNYLDTLQHAALTHLSLHTIREQAPAWVPHLRGAEDASYFSPAARQAAPPDIAAFRTRPPFAGQLPFVGYSYVAPDDNEDHSGGFNASHDCTAIDLATFKSSEKLAAMRAREIASLQSKLAEAEAAAGAAAEKARRQADDEAERTRAKLQGEITALTLQNKRLERQVEVEREERMALQRTNQELSATIAERNCAELQAAKAQSARAQSERDIMSEDLKRLEARVQELQDECHRAVTEADHVRQQQKHYKDTIAKERALRRQTLTGGETEAREFATRIAAAEANASRERSSRELVERRLHTADQENAALRAELEEVRRELSSAQESLNELSRVSGSNGDQLRNAQQQLSQEKVKSHTLALQVQELERNLSEACSREATLEEQGARTEARLRARLDEAETNAAAAAELHARHREKVNTLEQLVRQLEREVSALEKRSCPECEARQEKDGDGDADREEERRQDAQSDTESVADAASIQLAALKEQLERAEAHLQARADELATLRQEARTANLARWRKEREYNELEVEHKSTTRDLKRVEERLSAAIEARKTAEQKLSALQTEIATLRPDFERARQEADRYKEQYEKLQKAHEVIQVEVDRSRNDIRKLKCELQYSEKRRLHSEEQEELSTRERCQLQEQCGELRAVNADLVQNNKALQEACTMLEDQLTDLEKLADINEIKNKDLETEMQRLRSELEACRSRLSLAERGVAERSLEAALVTKQHDQVSEQAKHAYCQMQILNERLEHRESQISELESRVAELETERSGIEAALNSAMRRVRDLQEENSSLRTRAHEHHTHAMQLQANLSEVQEELACAREASDTAAAWWRTRETKADATLRQQAKLIDFLQAKVEEMGRKKHSLSNKLFGRSGRRPVASPPLRKANRELREEVERLRAKLAGQDMTDQPPSFRCPTTPKRELTTPKRGLTTPQRELMTPIQELTTPNSEKNSLVKSPTDSIKNTSSGANRDDKNVLVVWQDGTRESMRVSCGEGGVLLARGDRRLTGRLLDATSSLPYSEASRAFRVKLDSCGSEVEVVCEQASDKAELVAALAGGAYEEVTLRSRGDRPLAALCVAVNAVAIGYPDGLHSIRGPVSISVEGAECRRGAVTALAAVAGRCLLVYDGMLVHTGLLALGSAVRRASTLKPTLNVDRVRLPDTTPPHLIQVSADETSGGACAAVACGRRVFLLRWSADTAEFKVSRSVTVEAPARALLVCAGALYICGARPLRLALPGGALEQWAGAAPAAAAALRRRSPPRALLRLQLAPPELLLCYAECGVFLDERGQRTRADDPQWPAPVHHWEFVKPFLYLVGGDRVTILYITDDVYKAPPCTCDAASTASTHSEYAPRMYSLKVREPELLGTVPNGIIISTKTDDGYSVSVVEGLPAFKSIGASVESLATTSSRGSNSSFNECESERGDCERSNDLSQESVDVSTGFLADIRKRAKQLRNKNKSGPLPDEVIKEILTTEVGLKTSNGRKSPASITDSETEDADTDDKTYATKGTADLCGEMFARQVRFQ